MSLTADLLLEHEPLIESLTLLPARGGRFEVSIDGQLLFSKLALGRHAGDGEVLRLVRAWLDSRPAGPG